ncbi:MAG: prolipoprotein diacylglyceryl transferase [Myxococcales bacterium]|nr:prolipoprotein diacylglyceryl transferase [Myxococcales bacterium]
MHIDERRLQWVYTACVLLGLAVAVATPSAKRAIPPESRLKYAVLQVLTLVGAIVGAKVSFLVGDLDWPHAHVSLSDVVFSGRSITGGLLGGLVFAEVGKLALRYTELPNDAFAAKLPLSVAIGRAGCVFAGCCRGLPRDAGFTLTYSDGIARFPAQLWELGFQGVALAALVGLYRRGVLRGRLFALYITAYGAFRLVLEALRDTRRLDGGHSAYSAYQVFALALIACGVASFTWYSHVARRP